ncbi:MAG: hypothetical protein A2V70_19400 [Planctomycetes bacterium RBG_13_63_9]|nr:MAG: hypothetical protein A2V70_19400 [Planctomycetes bacterium RBG_13_63_9]
MAIALEMALPSAAGYWLDQQLGTKRLLLILGAILGLCAGMWHLLSLTKSPPGSGEISDRSTGDSRGRGK